MKIISIAIATVVLLISSSSCTRVYNCKCTTSYYGTSVSQTTTFKAKSQSEATDVCNNLGASGTGYSQRCSLQ